MSTRGLWGFNLDGELKVRYSHSDSYPSWLGIHLAKDLQGQDLGELADYVRLIRMVAGDAIPTAKELAALPGDLSARLGDDWSECLRNLDFDLVGTLALGIMADYRDFGYDSLFCEWAWIVDLDGHAFTVYRGGPAKTTSRGFWADGKVEPVFEGSPYLTGPIAPVVSFDLNEVVERGAEVITEWDAARKAEENKSKLGV
jgi:hypothetical protein